MISPQESFTFFRAGRSLSHGWVWKIYKTTSNGNATTGEMFDLVYQQGIPLEDMEFVQFHPTGLYPLESW